MASRQAQGLLRESRRCRVTNAPTVNAEVETAMTRTFRPEPEARAELEDTALSYESQRPGLEFVEAVDLALEQITGWPQIGRRVTGLRDDLPVRRVLVCASPTTSCTCRGKMRFEFWFAYAGRELG